MGLGFESWVQDFGFRVKGLGFRGHRSIAHCVTDATRPAHNAGSRDCPLVRPLIKQPSS
jgi:hypothetical protein